MLELECRHDLCLEPLSNLGEFCIIDSQCYDPLICNPELFACTNPPKKIGELCDLDTDYCDVGLVDDYDDNYDDTQDFFKQRKRWMQGIYLVCRFHAIIITITT